MQSTKQTSPLASSPSETLRGSCVSGTLCLQCHHPSCGRSLAPALLTSLENPGTTTRHQRLFIAVSDQLQKTRSRDSPTPPLPLLSSQLLTVSMPESLLWPTGAKHTLPQFPHELSSYCSLPAPAGTQAFSLFPKGTKQGHS